MQKFSTFVLTVVSIAVATSRCLSQSLPPVRQLGPVTAVSNDSLVAVSGIRALPDGRVLVNDIVGRRVLLLDSALTVVSVVADTTSATANAYGTRPGGLIAFRGDSTLFVDPASLSMLLIDPNGKLGRVMSGPRDMNFLIGGPFGTAGFDPSGKLVYRAPPNFAAFGGRSPGGNGTPPLPVIPDSAAIVRFDLATRKLDTVTYFKTPKVVMNVVRSPEGNVRVSAIVNPLPQGDDWALLPDGTIALVRTRDFHVDFLNPSGAITSAPKIAYSWERLTDSGKVALIDSARVAIEKQRAAGFAAGLAGAGGPPGVRVTVTADGPPAGASRTTAPNTTTTVTTVGAGAPPSGGPQLPPLQLVSPSELPDYKPAFIPGSTRVDADGNLWIRTTQNVDGRPVYDVVDSKGVLIDRVQLPANRIIVGFGPGGIAYLAVRDGTVVHLERARIR